MHLVGLNGRNFLIGSNRVADLLVPRLERTLADRFSHLGYFHSLSCNKSPKLTSWYGIRRVKNSAPCKRREEWNWARLAWLAAKDLMDFQA